MYVMGVIKVNIPDDEEEEFRKAAMDIFGHKKGSLSKAARKALNEWREKVQTEGFSEEILERMHGQLSHVDETSVEAQEKAIEERAKNAFD